MAEVSVADGVLKIELTVSERVLALHGRDVEVPLAQITTTAGQGYDRLVLGTQEPDALVAALRPAS